MSLVCDRLTLAVPVNIRFNFDKFNGVIWFDLVMSLQIFEVLEMNDGVYYKIVINVPATVHALSKGNQLISVAKF